MYGKQLVKASELLEQKIQYQLVHKSKQIEQKMGATHTKSRNNFEQKTKVARKLLPTAIKLPKQLKTKRSMMDKQQNTQTW